MRPSAPPPPAPQPPLPARPLARLFPFAVAVLSVTLAQGINWLLQPQIGPQIGPPYYAAVMISAWYGGLGPGLLATALAGATAALQAEPFGSLSVDVPDLLRILAFLMVAVLISGLNARRQRAERSLREAHAGLELRIAQRTAELTAANRDLSDEIAQRRRAEAALLAHQDRLRALATELALVEERQRRRLAGYLHDDVGQLLSSAQMQLESLTLAAPGAGTGPEAPSGAAPSADPAATLAQVRDLLDTAVERTRSLTCELSPPVLYELGFGAAVEWLAEQIAARGALRITVEQDGAADALPEPRQVLLFQAVRELLNNVVKHAHARSARVWVRRDGPELRLGVEDDGVGFDPALRPATCFGLFNIREQLQRQGGRLELDAAPGRGARFTLIVPWSEATMPAPAPTEPSDAPPHPPGR